MKQHTQDNAGNDNTAENNEALSALLRIAAEPLPLNQLLRQSLDVLLGLSWLSILPKGGIFLKEHNFEGREILRLAAEANLGKNICGLCATVEIGHCLCGRAAQLKEAVHASCIDERHETAFDGMEPHGHYNVPILSGDELLGVIVFYLPHGKQSVDEEIAFISRAAGIIALMIKLYQKERKLEKINSELSQQKSGLDEHAIVSIADTKGNIIYANDKFCSISGYSREELLGKNHRITKSSEHPDSFFKNMWETISSGKVWHGEIKNRTRDYKYYWVNCTIVPFLDDSGNPYQYLAIRTDITKQKTTEEAFSRAQKVANIGNWTFDIKNDKLAWSDQIYKIFGFNRNIIEASFPVFIGAIHPDDVTNVISLYQKSIEENIPYNTEHRIIRQDTGEVRWVHELCVHHRNERGNVIYSDGTVQDITDRKKIEEEISRLAMTDQLTGLANRRQFLSRLKQGMKLAQREEKKLILMLLDLDNFKPVNDRYGHQVGDKILTSVALQFSNLCRETDVISRFGGDEFAVLLIHPDGVQAAELCAQRIIDEISKPIIIDTLEITIGISIGISIFPDHARSDDDLIHCADLALYDVKRSGRNTYKIYKPSQES